MYEMDRDPNKTYSAKQLENLMRCTNILRSLAEEYFWAHYDLDPWWISRDGKTPIFMKRPEIDSIEIEDWGGVTVHLHEYAAYRGDGGWTHEKYISLSELADGGKVALAEASVVVAKRNEEAAKIKAEDDARKEELIKEARIRNEANDRQRLRDLMTLYPDEVKL